MVLPDVQSMIYRFISNNFNYSLLVTPSFANGGNLFVPNTLHNLFAILQHYNEIYLQFF